MPVGYKGVVKLSIVVTLLAMTLVITPLWPIATADQGKKAWLRMSIVDTDAPTVYYQETSSDPWFDDSIIVETESGSGTFYAVIRVTNIHSSGEVHDITLVLATNDPSVVSLTVESPLNNIPLLNRSGMGIVDMRTDGGDYLADMPGHGVYNAVPPPDWFEYRALPDPGPVLNPTQYVDFRVNFTLTNAPNDWKLHADAYGWTVDPVTSNKHEVVNGDGEDAAFVPFSKDITFTVPEFEASAYLLASFAVVFLLFRKRLGTNIRPIASVN